MKLGFQFAGEGVNSILNSGHDYYVLQNGQLIKYQAYAIWADFNTGTHFVTVTDRTGTIQFTQRYSVELGCAITDHLPQFASENQTNGDTLIQSWGFGSTSSGTVLPYLGEIGHNLSNGANIGYVFPPEPQITLFPVAGERMEVYSTVYNGCDNPTVKTQTLWTTYTTQGHYDTWGAYHDVWVTTLVEHGSSDHVYMYVIAKGIGIIVERHGQVDYGTNTLVNGKEYYIISHSNP